MFGHAFAASPPSTLPTGDSAVAVAGPAPAAEGALGADARTHRHGRAGTRAVLWRASATLPPPTAPAAAAAAGAVRAGLEVPRALRGEAPPAEAPAPAAAAPSTAAPSAGAPASARAAGAPATPTATTRYGSYSVPRLLLRLRHPVRCTLVQRRNLNLQAKFEGVHHVLVSSAKI